MSAERRAVIPLTLPEITSRHDRQRQAEALIQQLPSDHDGRAMWLINYGEGNEARALREADGVQWDTDTRSARPILSRPTHTRVVEHG